MTSSKALLVSVVLLNLVNSFEVKKTKILGQHEPISSVDFDEEKDKSVTKDTGTSLAVSPPLPAYRENHSYSDYAAKAALALAGIGVIATVATIPLYASTDGAMTLGRQEEITFGSIFSRASSWGRAIGFEDCGQMTICDAHARTLETTALLRCLS